MQEDQTVNFQPMYDGYSQPWITKLLVLYLLFVLVLFVVRVLEIGLTLRSLRKLQKHPGRDPITPDTLWSNCCMKARSLKSFATLTFLLSLLDFTWSVSDILFNVRTEKTVNAAFILPSMGEALVPLSLGLIFCVALYVTSMVAESALRRSRFAVTVVKSKNERSAIADH